MIRSLASVAAAIALTTVPAVAQTPPRMAGAEVIDAKGKAVGKIEKVITGSDGRPAQVLVRVDRVLRTLPVDALSPAGDRYASVLSRAEITALPPSE